MPFLPSFQLAFSGSRESREKERTIGNLYINFIISDEKIEGSNSCSFTEIAFSLTSLQLAGFNLSNKFILLFHFLEGLGSIWRLPIVRDGLIYTVLIF